MSGFYFKTKNNNYFYDNSTGEVQEVTDSNARAIVYDKKILDPKRKRHEIGAYSNDVHTTHLILVVSEECNLRCKYCAYSGIYTNQRTHSHKRMSQETAQRAIDNYFDFFKKVKHTNVTARPTITFYGGEPLTNFPIVRFAIEYSKKLYAGEITYSITVNATLLTEEIIDYFVKNDVSLVISLNGDKKENDKSRVFPDGRGTFDIIMNKINYLRENHLDYYNKRFAISATIDTGTDLIEFDGFFNTGKFKTVPIAISKVAKAYSDWYEQFDECVKEKYDAQIRFLRDKFIECKTAGKHIDNVKMGLFNTSIMLILNRCIGPIKSVIPFTGACLPGMKIAVNCDGELSLCEKVNHTRPIGNVNTWIDYKLVNELIETYIATLQKNCSVCPVSRMCGVCYKDIFDEHGNGKAPDITWCRNYAESVQKNFEMIYALMESGVTSQELLGRHG